MQAVMITGTLTERVYGTVSPVHWTARPALRLGLRPSARLGEAITGLSRAGMGMSVGTAFACLSGNGAFWIALGLGLGLALNALASRVDGPAQPAPKPDASLPYRIR